MIFTHYIWGRANELSSIDCLNHYGALFQAGATFVAVFVSAGIAICLSRKQHRTSIFIKAMDNLTSADPLKIETAVHELRTKEYKSKKFKEKIRFAFIKRLKKYPLDKYCESEMRTRLTYAQWILLWLYKNHKNKYMDLDECDFTNQDFVIEKMKFANLFSRTKVKYSNLRFRNARICNKWLDDADKKFWLNIEKEKENKHFIFECECDEGECTKTLATVQPLHPHALDSGEIHF